MKKEDLRREYKKKRSQLSHNERDELSIRIANQTLKLPVWNWKTYHIFLPIERLNEIDTNYILHILHGKDKNVVLPKTDLSSRTLTHILLTDQTVLKENDWGIAEPEDGIEVPSKQIDAVFMPLLAYDVKGNRVGYGKGYYDRFLLECKPDVIKVGISYFPPEKVIDNVSSADIPLDFCVTPDGVFTF